MNTTIHEGGRALLALNNKVALLGTIDDEGCPHLTFLNTIQGLGERNLTFGQFTAGLCKEHLQQRPDCAFLALGADRTWVRGNARYTHTAVAGLEFDDYNNKPLFRYNSYVGINTVWYLDLLGISDMHKLDALKVVIGSIKSRAIAKRAAKNENQALSPFSMQLCGQVGGPKFLCYESPVGGLMITPVVQAKSAGTDGIAIAPVPFGEELALIPDGADVAFYALNLKMQNVLVKGIFNRAGKGYAIDIQRVYNAMPPLSGYIYPKAERPAEVIDFV